MWEAEEQRGAGRKERRLQVVTAFVIYSMKFILHANDKHTKTESKGTCYLRHLSLSILTAVHRGQEETGV